MRLLIKVLLFTLFLTFPLIKLIGFYLHHKHTFEEVLKFEIEVLGKTQNVIDTVLIEIIFDVPNYYTLKQHKKVFSDCITCGNQYYLLYKNPSKETMSEKDTIFEGFFSII